MKEKMNFDIVKNKKLKNKKLIIFLIISISITNFAQAYSFSKGDIEWADPVSGTLYKDDILKNGNYSVKAVQFPGPVFGVKDINGNWIPENDVDTIVIIDIYKDDKLIKEAVLDQNSPFIDDDFEVKIFATNFIAKNAKEWIYQYYRPWVDISIQLRAKPKFDISIVTDKDEYTSFEDQIIEMNITVINNGDTFAKNIDMYINVGDLKLRGDDKLHQNYYRLEKGKSQTIQLILLVPEILSEEKTFDLSASVIGYDLKDIKYDFQSKNTSIRIIAAPTYFTIDKSVRDNMFLRDTATVRITISNGGIYDITNINIRDTINENFELVNIENDISNISEDKKTIFWNVSALKPMEDWKTSYNMRPLNINIDGFSIPSAIVDFTVRNKHYIMSSKNVNIVVNGPKIILYKIVDKETASIGENVKVTLKVNNIGDIATKVIVNDSSIPDNVMLISGNTTNSIYLEPNIPQEFSYLIGMKTNDEVRLPSAIANYTDMEYMKLTKSTIKSNIVIINNKSKIEINKTINELIPSVTGIPLLPKETKKAGDIGIKYIALIIVLIIYELLKSKKNWR